MAERTMNIVEHDLRWEKMFEIEKAILKKVFNENIIQIEHIGSTSVPNLAAKPIIDIIIIVYDINKVDEFNAEMAKYGYTAKGEYGMPGRRYFVKFKEDGVNRTHHVHIFEKENLFTDKMLLFRDFLRVNQQARTKYENTKRELSKKYYHDSTSYTNGKSDCINEILTEAKQFFHI